MGVVYTEDQTYWPDFLHCLHDTLLYTWLLTIAPSNIHVLYHRIIIHNLHQTYYKHRDTYTKICFVT
jgi:hypothetical protein